MKTMVVFALMFGVAFAATSQGAMPSHGSVGNGHGIAHPGRSNPCNGTLSIKHDGSAEDGYCWQYGGVLPPLYGAFDVTAR